MLNNNVPGVVLAQKPTLKTNLKRPEGIRVCTDLKFERDTAEQLFPMLKFEPEDTHVTITEVLRPAKGAAEEKCAVMHHLQAGVKYVVDHYEFEGHRL